MSMAYDELRQRLQPHQGDWLKKSLEVSGVSAHEIAEMLEISPRTMTNYLKGTTHPKRRDLREWALRTGVPLTYLMTGQLDELPSPDGGVGRTGLEPVTGGL